MVESGRDLQLVLQHSCFATFFRGGPWKDSDVRAKMAYVFRGQYEAKIDTESRLAVPAGLRSDLPNEGQLVVTNSVYRGETCLDVYTWSAWQDLEKRIAQLPKLNADIQAFQRFYLSAGQPVNLDSQNRILLPKTLKSFAQIDNEVVLVGMGEKFEIWSKSIWTKITNELSENFEKILAGVSSLEDDS